MINEFFILISYFTFAHKSHYYLNWLSIRVHDKHFPPPTNRHVYHVSYYIYFNSENRMSNFQITLMNINNWYYHYSWKTITLKIFTLNDQNCLTTNQWSVLIVTKSTINNQQSTILITIKIISLNESQQSKAQFS